MEMRTKYCKYCGAKIAWDAVVCPECGRQVEVFNSERDDRQIIINNSASSSASAAASASASAPEKRRKHYNLLVDLLLCLVTGGVWFVWMLIRPKYEY